MSTIDELKARKSVRVFEERTISEEIKEQLYTAAFEAPTAGNQMLYSVIVVRDDVTKQKLAQSCDHQAFIATASSRSRIRSCLHSWQRPAIISSGSRRRSWPSSLWRITAAGSTCMRQPAVRRAVLASATCGWR